VITCRTLGPVQVLVDGEPAPAELLWRKNVALLVYLARSPKRVRTRDHLIGLLWVDKSEAAARQSLREALRVLRHSLGESGMDAGGDQVTLTPGAVSLDVDRFAELAERGEWAAAAQLVAGEFLEGFSVPDASGFEDWLEAERLAWRRRSVEAIARAAEQRLQAGDAAAATELGLKALELDALSEPALRAVMRSLAVAGDRAGALSRYQAYVERLKTSTGADPTAELCALADQVRRQRSWRVPDYLVAKPAVGAESRRAPLIGREPQLADLTTAWATVRSERRAAVAIIAADPGLGKTRLLEEVLVRARLEGAATATVTGVSADRGQPGNGLLGLMRGGLLEAPGVASAQPSALASLAAELPEWADRFGKQVRGAQPQPLPRATSEVLRAAAEEQPVLLAVDDAHHLDPESLDALAAVVRDLAACPLCLVLATDSQGGPPELDLLWSHLGRDLPGVTVRLEPLDAAAMLRLARWALPSYSDADLDRVARRVGADSAGLPLLAVELLHAIAVGLDLGTVTGAWPQPLRTLSQTLPGDLPGAVVAAIRVGFRRLSEPAQRALGAAAVLGEREQAERIGRATGLEGERLSAALDELEWQRWLVADARGYAFLARIVRDVVARDMVSPGQRQRLQAAAEGTT
jgi:DNA-binding SARP family transcriptional activator